MKNKTDSEIANLIDAINSLDMATVKRLLQGGVSPCGVLDSANVTPLHFAAQQNAIGIIRLLLSSGADRAAMTQPDGQTAFDIAKLHGHKEAMALLG